MSKATVPKLISKFNKNSVEVVRVQLVRYDNTDLLDVRVWIQNDKGDFIPTRKGISLRLDQIDSLKEVIDKAAEELARWKRDI